MLKTYLKNVLFMALIVAGAFVFMTGALVPMLLVIRHQLPLLVGSLISVTVLILGGALVPTLMDHNWKKRGR